MARVDFDIIRFKITDRNKRAPTFHFFLYLHCVRCEREEERSKEFGCVKGACGRKSSLGGNGGRRRGGIHTLLCDESGGAMTCS